jgi:hypothetical protein
MNRNSGFLKVHMPSALQSGGGAASTVGLVAADEGEADTCEETGLHANPLP